MFTNQIYWKPDIFTRTQTFLLCILAFIIMCETVVAQSQQPNIILILADDFGYENLRCNGGESYQTPNLDAMAAQGLRFTQVHSCPNCSPSRFELMTGVYNFRNYNKWGVMPTSNRTFGNVLHDAGYKTGIFGKWQLDGGDASIHAFGFDDYIIYDPLRTMTDNEDSVEDGSRYKNPHLYANGNYLPATQMNGKYGDDVLVDSLRTFITRNKDSKFFAYYTMISPHIPFTPTPDDFAFSTWDPNLPGDTSMYPSMIKYLDKKVGQILKFIDSLGISERTIILFTGDNGTTNKIYSWFNGVKVKGGKGNTVENATHVPLLVKWQGHTPVGVDTSLIDFTDFYPTLADIANASHDSLDGISFYPQITAQKGALRNSIFCHFQKNPSDNTPLYRWAQDRRFKLYDSTILNNAYLFYDIVRDVKEKKPLADSLLSSQKAIIKHQLLEVINSHVIHSIPVLSNPIILAITDSSVTIKDSILSNSGANITACGMVWDTLPDPQLASGAYTVHITSTGSFIDYITSLKLNTTYYVKAYATNLYGTAYSNQVIFKTLAHIAAFDLLLVKIFVL
ncbi:MAG TPA: sulfatase-like hydrolase/transferase [Parafilimonas sp.]|nr:sulfatase-like hydrolase/transferase [Parafilimonas sp.]